jgi:signal transduction histidine kinase/CheY-like chemotaxis protein
MTLLEKNDLFEAWFNQTPNYYLILDQDRKIIRANAAMSRFLARPGEDLSGLSLKEVLFCSNIKSKTTQCGKGDHCKMCPFHRALVSILGQEDGASPTAHAFHRNIAGTESHFLLSASPLRTAQGKLVLLSMEDVTRLRQAEEEAERFKRMHALGNLAGRIAHDLNNICTVVLGNISLAHLTGKLDDDCSEIVDNIEDATLRAADLGQELLTFSNGGAPIVSPLALNNLVSDIVTDTGKEHGVIVETQFPEDLWPILGDEDQITTACKNILSNAAEAIVEVAENDSKKPDSGNGVRHLQVSVSAVNREIASKELSFVEEGRYVELLVSDNGRGISPDDLDFVTTPFFSRKDGKEGIGLSAAWSIMERHHGKISIRSNEEEGTTVSLLIPAAPESALADGEAPIGDSHKLRALTDSAVRELREAKAAVTAAGTKKGTILFMDDNKVLRLATGELLKFLGWEVTETADGTEAISEYEKAYKSDHPYDVVILDLTVAEGMGGLETMDKLLKIDPEVKAIVSSGYHHDPIMANFWEYGFSDCIKKPYMATRLNESISKVVFGEEPKKR